MSSWQRRTGSGFARAVMALALISATGCALLPSGSKARREHIYHLALAPDAAAPAAEQTATCGTAQVATGAPAVGHRGSAMVYTQDSIELKYFAYARWADAPGRMLRDELRRRLRHSGAFAGVLDAPVVTATDYHLEIADAAVRQHFDGDDASTLHLSFELRVFDGARRALLGSRVFSAARQGGDNPEAGVAAAAAGAAQLLAEATDYTLSLCQSTGGAETGR